MKKSIFMVIMLVFLCLFTSCKDENEGKTFKLTINYGKGIESFVQEYEYKTVVEEPTKPTYEHEEIYKYTDEEYEEVTFPITLTSDLVIWAEWQEAVYTYKFYDTDLTTVIYEGTGHYGDKVTLPTTTPTKERGDHESYEFSFWYPNTKTIVGNMEFVPRFTTLIDQCKVSFYSQDALYFEDEISYNVPIRAASTPKYQGAAVGYYGQFLGWVKEGETEYFNFDQTILEDVKLNAVFLVDKITTKDLSECLVSVEGDSLSSFYSSTSKINSIYHGNQEYFYPLYAQGTVTKVEQMWWYQTIIGVGAQLGVMECKSGSTACGSGDTEYRLKNLGAKGIPNIVILEFGGNDNVSGTSAERLHETYERMIEYISTNYVEHTDEGFVIPQIYVMNNYYSDYTGYNTLRVEYNKMFANLPNEYTNVHLFDINSLVTEENHKTYLVDLMHLNLEGMNLVAENFKKQILNDWGK